MDADFLIIGGGIAGISAAARLSALGSVTVLEAETSLAHHASGRSAAMYEPRYGVPAVVVRWPRVMLSGDQGVLSARGLMIVARPDDAEAFERDAAVDGPSPR